MISSKVTWRDMIIFLWQDQDTDIRDDLRGIQGRYTMFDIIEAGMRDVMIDSGGEGSILNSEGCDCQTQHHGRIGKPLLQLLMKHEKEFSNLRSSDGAVVAYAWNLLLTEPEVPDVNTLTYERLDWSKQSSLLARSSSETLDEPPKDHGFNKSRDIRSGSEGVVASDQIIVIELFLPTVFRAVTSFAC
ncbi:hypothetical protein Tco_0862638 [Tanacetum coccineum]